MECRILPYMTADGPAQMAWDEALLNAAIADPSTAWLRVYAWSEPWLSLGYFQEIARRDADPRWRDVPTVRRMTGGGAIWHDRELTYAVVLPSSHPFAQRSIQAYQAVHDAIGQVLARDGLSARRRGSSRSEPPSPSPSLSSERAAAKPFLCFLDQDENDLVIDGVKVLGSAQRRRDRTLIQHGSLLLRASPHAPELLGVADLAPNPIPMTDDPDDWVEPVLDAVLGALDLSPSPSSSLAEPPPMLREAARTAERDVFRDPAWTRRR